MERRLLIAILLTFLVLTAYQWLLPTPPPEANKTPAPAAVPAQGATNAAAAAVTPTLPEVETIVADAADRTIVVDNGVVRASFSNRGGTITKWQLIQYQDNAGQPLDLVPQDVPGAVKPFSLKIGDDAKTARLNTSLYSVSAGSQTPSATTPGATVPSTIDARTAPATLTFEYEDASGLHARKQFRLDPHSYVVDFSPTVLDGDRPVNPQIQWGPGLGDVLPLKAGGNLRRAEAIYNTGGRVTRIAAAKLLTAPTYEGTYDFAGVDTHYFAALALKATGAHLEYHPMSLPVPGSQPPLARDYVGYTIAYPEPPTHARFFVGPKHFDSLKRADPELVRAIYFGMFSFLSVPLLTALNWVHAFVGNYGWSIIVLTIIINAAMFPLRHKSFASMRKMQEIQPQVKTIQDRYAKLKMADPARQKMNTELMELYKTKGVNPASGCVPMLLTFPVLLAFYGLLSEAIELRGAPFVFWLKDLSVADPYYVTPILMGISQVVQQKMTPMSGADPVQQKMMLFMPVVFTFLFITSPSGLALYWFASNVLVIAQQQLTSYLIGPPVIRTPRTPAERRMKRVGESKTDAVSEGTES